MKVSEAVFLKYLNKILAPHGISTDDLSSGLLSIISRTFERIDSINENSATDETTKVTTDNIA